MIQWLRDKFGRIVTVVGALLQGIDTLDITPIKQPIEEIIGHRWLQGIIVGLFVLSYLRHQYVASQHPK